VQGTTDAKSDSLPCSLVIVKLIEEKFVLLSFRALFDSGSNTTFINDHYLPSGATAKVIPRKTGQTLVGPLKRTQVLILHELSCSCHVDHLSAYVFSGTCKHDVIFGRDLRLISLSQDFSTGIMSAFGITIEMKPKS
jgi:hypothetical protein